MSFEVFERKSRPTSTVPTVGLQTRGTMSLNAAAFELLTMEKPKRPDRSPVKPGKQKAKAGKRPLEEYEALVEFLFDKERAIVGLRVAQPTGLNSYPVRRQPQSESYLVTAKAFLTYHGIQTDQLRRYTARLYDGEILGFSLKEDELK